MKKIKYEVRLNDNNHSFADALFGKLLFEYKSQVNDLRLLQSTILQLGRILSDMEGYSAVLIINQTKFSKLRLQYEWQSLQKLIRSSILTRIRIIVFAKDSIIAQFGDLNEEEKNVMFEIRKKLSKTGIKSDYRKPDAFFEILRIMIVCWFRKTGPLKLNRLSQISGFSYPTVALALERLNDKLIRHSDRSVELKSFPLNEWLKLVSNSTENRLTYSYWSFRPKPIQDLINRLNEKPDNKIAFGGIIGARHYLPGIDLIGIPRLDLSVQNMNASEIHRLVQRIDPGLKKEERGTIPQLVIHVLTRPDPLFLKNKEQYISDETECLLDLHDAMLDGPYLELLEHLKINPNEGSETS